MQTDRNSECLTIAAKIPGQTVKNLDHITTSKFMPTLGVDKLLKARGSIDRKDTYLEWKGSVYAFVPQERQQKLFNIIGMNVSRCIRQDENKWLVTSREITLYLDPDTNEVLNYWQNPWTGETVPVVHVTLNPIQIILEGEYPVFVQGKNVTFVLDIPLTYPNILGNNAKYRDYSPQPLYQAGEFFQYAASMEEILDPSIATANLQAGSWMRIGPWLPWMKMKDRSGHLVYSASMKKYLKFEELLPTFQELIDSRLPAYKEAPQGFVPGKNETSWTYFHRHFEQYLQGAKFPIPEPLKID